VDAATSEYVLNLLDISVFHQHFKAAEYGIWYVAACCSVLQRVAACCSVLQHCSVLQRAAVCCSVLQRVAVYSILSACLEHLKATEYGTFYDNTQECEIVWMGIWGGYD